MLLSNLEYVPLRLMRRFLLADRTIARFSKFVPYYRTNQGELDPRPVVDAYEKGLSTAGVAIRGRRVAELGVGATNSTAYALALRGAESVLAVEPYVPLDRERDQALFAKLADGHDVRAVVSRVSSLAAAADGSVDIVLSSSVLEHVRDLDALFSAASRALTPRGCMLHLVDYRDHFFKYPYHFLQFRRETWDRYLDPGDLPRWRLSDHLRALGRHGFAPRVLESTTLEHDFARIRGRLSADFDPSDPTTAVATATIFAARSTGNSSAST